jgi:diguanylate cyclase (GGDEF)-like protein
MTGTIENMYQNTTMVPIAGLSGTVEHVAIMVYNVTTAATNSLALTAVNSELQKLSRSDQLTGLNNRAYWEECLVREFRRYQRSRHPTTLVMFDIDHFKKVNDTYGHVAGDAVIRATAQVLRTTMRETDIAGRYGGEEFGVVLTGTGATDATHFAERLRTAIASNPVQHHANTIAYTISLGIAELEQGIVEHKHWIERSDRALYHSKQNGRNRHTLYEQTIG